MNYKLFSIELITLEHCELQKVYVISICSVALSTEFQFWPQDDPERDFKWVFMHEKGCLEWNSGCNFSMPGHDPYIKYGNINKNLKYQSFR